MLASKVLITAGTPGHMYLDDKHAKCLKDRNHIFKDSSQFIGEVK